MTDPSADKSTDQTRREALEKFGKYAAAASAFTVLLRPHDGHALPGKAHGKAKGRQKSRDKRHY